ncbi:LacI family DNA-binding transcriptional regulator [Ectobacillus sp. sgz5001026]|uniref:LacI family DNA-binding transcriptional regulator n=1 Tax=Ectobacillus sp. sgz5001026 TaxID=3242473 RepID=UPI0036D3A8F2
MKTISDIASIAGVAKSTVSRFLNGGSVSERTRQKIERAIKETGFVPNPFAQSLKAKVPNIIGTIVPRLDSYAASQTLIGIDEYLRELGYQMFIANTSQSLEREIESIYTLAHQKVAGIILLATQITEEHIEAFQKINIPIMLVGQEYNKVYSVIHDDYGAGYEMGKYVLGHGHRKLAYLGVTEKDIAVGVKRKAGFTQAVQEQAGCEVRYFETSFSMMDSIQIVSSIIHTYSPTVIVCATDNLALGAMKAAYVNELQVPHDLSITGFGGYDVAEMLHPSLTTTKFYYKQAGKRAAERIVKLVNKEEIPLQLISNFKIVDRESVDKKV